VGRLTDGQPDEAAVHELGRLIQEGRAAALAGDTIAARAAFRRATDLDPDSVEALIGLSSAVPILAEKRGYLRRALELDAQHSEARASLEYVERLIADGQQIAPAQRMLERRASGDASPLLSAPEPETAPAVETLHCYIHPDRETGLRCIQCGRPICGACAQVTPVGQLCPECRKARRPSNYQVGARDIAVGAVVALVASLVVALLLTLFRLGFLGLFLMFIIGPAIAEFIVRVVDRVTKLKRGRPMQIAVGVAIALGTLPFALLNPLLFLYMALAITTAVARLR
jgi:hypothetical protein